METHYTAMERVRLVAGHVRLLADLMLPGGDLADVDRAAFAQVLSELAHQLEVAAYGQASNCPCTICSFKGGQV